MLFLVANALTRQEQDSTFFLASARTEANFSSRFALAAGAFSITEFAHAKYSSRRSNGQSGGGSLAISPTLWILSPSLMSVASGENPGRAGFAAPYILPSADSCRR